MRLLSVYLAFIFDINIFFKELLLIVIRYSLFAIRYSLFVIHYSLFVIRYLVLAFDSTFNYFQFTFI